MKGSGVSCTPYYNTTDKEICSVLLVLYWTGTSWSGVDNEKAKEGKRLIFPGLHSQLSQSRESARNRERESEREREGKKERKTRGPKL